jgi:hypothetical protein
MAKVECIFNRLANANAPSPACLQDPAMCMYCTIAGARQAIEASRTLLAQTVPYPFAPAGPSLPGKPWRPQCAPGIAGSKGSTNPASVRRSGGRSPRSLLHPFRRERECQASLSRRQPKVARRRCAQDAPQLISAPAWAGSRFAGLAGRGASKGERTSGPPSTRSGWNRWTNDDVSRTS